MTALHTPISDDHREELKHLDDFTSALLIRRGISTKEEAEAFLNPSYDLHLGDPLLITDMEKAVKRIVDALERKERICVWSDYDCDGIPGGTILHDFFKKVGANFTNYIPHRHEEGFGINEGGVTALKKEGVSLIITVDCGIADVAMATYVASLGIDVIVTDHHLPVQGMREDGTVGDILPQAVAVVDPKRSDETYPYRDFCGAGLAWKLVCALLQFGFPGREEISPGWEKWLLDMAGLATIADMVPLTGENRVIARYGLMVMRKSRRLGLQALCRVGRVEQRLITEDDVGFTIGPRVNAASRMSDPRIAFELFTTDDPVRAEVLAKELEKINRSRRASSGAVTKAVRERLQEYNGVIPEVIVMGDPEWRPGLLGLVANTIAEEYQRPVYLWGREGSREAKGSCRAGRKELDVVEIMSLCKEGTFIEFGGHRASGGFSVRGESVFDLPARLNDAYATLPPRESVSLSVLADAQVHPEDISYALLNSLERMTPFGMGNPKPLFVLRDVIVRDVSWFGKEGEHLRMSIESNQQRDPLLEAIAFFAKGTFHASATRAKEDGRATLAVHIEKDQFTRRQKVRLRVVSIT
jgi:single-stranded-DNA-specific exonuclease